MSYQTYITPAIICGSFDNNTADKSYLLFTKTAGMLYATARSVREERSRQRFALQDFGLITVSLIKGKTGWRIGSVQSEGNLFSSAESRVVRGSIVRLIKFVRRFVGTEEPQTELYEEICLGLEYLANEQLTKRLEVEDVLQARVLYELGYIADTTDLTDIFLQPLATVLETSLPPAVHSRLKQATTIATVASHL